MPRKKYAQTLTELAREFGMTPQAIHKWNYRPGFPGRGPKGFDIEAIRKWRDERRAETAMLQGTGGQSREDAGDLKALKTKHEVAKLRQETRFKRLKNDLLEERLIDYDDVSRWIAEKFLRVKQRLQSLPNEMQVLAPAEQRGMFRASLESFICELLMEMEGWRYDSANETNESGGEDSENE